MAPSGCLQYITDTTSTGIIKTFNFDQGVHLANQFQQICFRYVNNSLSFFYRIKPEILVQAWLPQDVVLSTSFMVEKDIMIFFTESDF